MPLAFRLAFVCGPTLAVVAAEAEQPDRRHAMLVAWRKRVGAVMPAANKGGRTPKPRASGPRARTAGGGA